MGASTAWTCLVLHRGLGLATEQTVGGSLPLCLHDLPSGISDVSRNQLYTEEETSADLPSFSSASHPSTHCRSSGEPSTAVPVTAPDLIPERLLHYGLPPVFYVSSFSLRHDLDSLKPGLVSSSEYSWFRETFKIPLA